MKSWRYILVVVVAGPSIAPHNPDGLAPLQRYKPPSAAYWLGTDQYGRDILSHLLVGARATVVRVVYQFVVIGALFIYALWALQIFWRA